MKLITIIKKLLLKRRGNNLDSMIGIWDSCGPAEPPGSGSGGCTNPHPTPLRRMKFDPLTDRRAQKPQIEEQKRVWSGRPVAGDMRRMQTGVEGNRIDRIFAGAGPEQAAGKLLRQGVSPTLRQHRLVHDNSRETRFTHRYLTKLDWHINGNVQTDGLRCRWHASMLDYGKRCCRTRAELAFVRMHAEADQSDAQRVFALGHMIQAFIGEGRYQQSPALLNIGLDSVHKKHPSTGAGYENCYAVPSIVNNGTIGTTVM
ncbi:hypothetical protein [Geobacter sp. SVR]|uniref:hypothetical protein n=1 Tax=Geobacter sp. SVR TaxID=2495594 RepID=UPI001563196E|nr:hypothetical protein [Geobacter sp. SVR]